MADATDLPRQPSRAADAVNVLLFSRENCPFCRVVRENYLLPLANAGPSVRPARVRVGEIDIDGARPLVDFDGRETTEAALARVLGMRFSPTVAFVDGRGRPLADPIVGLSPDWFGAYLDAALTRALAR